MVGKVLPWISSERWKYLWSSSTDRRWYQWFRVGNLQRLSQPLLPSPTLFNIGSRARSKNVPRKSTTSWKQQQCMRVLHRFFEIVLCCIVLWGGRGCYIGIVRNVDESKRIDALTSHDNSTVAVYRCRHVERGFVWRNQDRTEYSPLPWVAHVRTLEYYPVVPWAWMYASRLQEKGGGDGSSVRKLSRGMRSKVKERATHHINKIIARR